MLVRVDFPLSNTCQFLSPNRGEENRRMIAAEKKDERKKGGLEGGSRTEGRGAVLI